MDLDNAMTPGSDTTKTVLLVEDDPIARETVAEVLRSAGYHVATAADGRQALKYLRENAPPACIALDLLMPVMDGWEFLRHCRRSAALALLPVVVMSAARDVASVARELGAQAYLTKPFEVDAVLAVIGRLADGASCGGGGARS